MIDREPCVWKIGTERIGKQETIFFVLCLAEWWTVCYLLLATCHARSYSYQYPTYANVDGCTRR